MRIELLVFDGCPHAEATERSICAILDDEGATAEIVRVAVGSAEEAVALRFLGSPSVRINGQDVERAANDRSAYGLMCRTYGWGTAAVGTLPAATIRAAIRRNAFDRRRKSGL